MNKNVLFILVGKIIIIYIVYEIKIFMCIFDVYSVLNLYIFKYYVENIRKFYNVLLYVYIFKFFDVR